MAGRSDAGLCTVAGADVPSSSEPVALKPGHEGDGGRYTDGLRCAQLPSAGPATSHHVCRSCAGNLRCWSPSRPSRTWREPGVAARGGAQPRRSRDRREARVVAAVRERGGLVAAARPASGFSEGQQPLPAGARLLLRPPAKLRAESRSGGLARRMRRRPGAHATLEPAGGLVSVVFYGVCVRFGVSRCVGGRASTVPCSV